MPQDNFTLLRTILRALGLPPEAIDDIVARILDLLGGRKAGPDEFPYCQQDHFLSPAEHSFYLILAAAVGDWATICPKVGLGELFWVKSSDPSVYRTGTNRIDRKHVDFVLCDPGTMKPLVGIELDDRSHQRSDRQERDAFVEEVFATAQLPLVRLPVRRAYVAAELRALLRGQAGIDDAASMPSAVGTVTAPPQTVTAAATTPAEPPARTPGPAMTAAVPSIARALAEPEQPRCPECNAPMVLRTATRGANQGGKFWGCPNYPRCRGIVKWESGRG